MTGSLVSFLAGVFLLRNLDTIDAGLAGLSLSFSSTFLEHIYWLVRQVLFDIVIYAQLQWSH